MSEQVIHPSKYSELRNIYKYYIDSYIKLYQLKTENEEELNSIYKMIKTELIDSKKHLPQNIVRDILNIIPYNNRYIKSYLILAKLISDDYHVKEVHSVESISNYMFYKEYGIKLNICDNFEKIKTENLDILSENTIYRAIMKNDKEKFIAFTELEGFDHNQRRNHDLYPVCSYYEGYSLLELCCYHGAADCFKLLRSKFNSEITQSCLDLSFLGGNKEIMSECLKYQKPYEKCMEYAITSHNIDFVTFLMNEYNIKIDLYFCGKYKNLESFLVYYDQTNDVNISFPYSAMFDIPPLCEYFLSLGAYINETNKYGKAALHFAAEFNSKDIAELLISYGANIHEKDKDEKIALHYAAKFNSKEVAEVLISYGTIINEKDYIGKTALHYAAKFNSKEIAELLISHGININEKNENVKTALHYATEYDSKEIAELLISHGANIHEKDKDGKTALHYAAEFNSKEIAELLISYGANINEKDKYGMAALQYAAEYNLKEIAKLLISHGANINEKDHEGKNTLQYTTKSNI
ncbi:hypothetical protein TVAG_493830 [Trichomonas vaginalis G3]|uniref:DUF3447 domain-containing protein n=1 Tax=Trichomonas vaginalis (strain ATCC PRA-98 / G3) TaxID=412133 RepID=A2DQ14_TRIV3|nr:ankyrin repeat and SOCS box-containing protein 4 family [Trichomonas vaginalis G3]EAY17441.1 hypothetical protein TVAG_493830 [Trichomonas vaginalis G3]KAI5533536.1 ankyrin repeat and SOCS box-containing protein 4 family [Trichomonas vaginalis G3]|eukprot:XP_001329576.1 hypothetical protein [Trichomonas vaginalis G3]